MESLVKQHFNPTPRGLIPLFDRFAFGFITKRPHFSFFKNHLNPVRQENRLGISELRLQCESIGMQRGSQGCFFLSNILQNARIQSPPASSKPSSMKITRGRCPPLSHSIIYPVMINISPEVRS